MLGNFSYSNPTKLHFGEQSIRLCMMSFGNTEKRVMLVYGGGSIKRNGIYDEVVGILKAEEKIIYEDAGVMPNPTVEKIIRGMQNCTEKQVDLILAVGGGSVCDYAKGG